MAASSYSNVYAEKGAVGSLRAAATHQEQSGTAAAQRSARDPRHDFGVGFMTKCSVCGGAPFESGLTTE